MQQDSGFREYNFTDCDKTIFSSAMMYKSLLYVTCRKKSEKTCNPTRKVLRNFKGEPWTVDNKIKETIMQKSS